MCSPIIFVDFSYYYGFNKEPVIKEIAYRSLKGDFGGHAIFSPPYTKTVLPAYDNYTVEWLEKHLDAIPWKDGLQPYSHVQRVLNALVRYKPRFRIFLKSLEKKKILSSLLSSPGVFNCNVERIVDMESLSVMPSFRELRKHTYPAIYQFCRCYYHTAFCALGNIHCLVQWYYDTNYSCYASSSDEDD